MNWMKKWAGAFPIFVKSAKGAHFTDTETASDIDAHTQIFASAVRELAG